MILQALTDGVFTGAIVSLGAIGLSLTLQIMRFANFAHAEFMTIGAYTIFFFSHLAESFAPKLVQLYFPFAIAAAFCIAFAVGWLVEWAFIRHLYKRPLDTLLATWGLSLVAARSSHG